MWTEEETQGLLPFCLDTCLYWAPMGYKKGKIWCALKGAWVEPGRKCKDYKERKEVKKMEEKKIVKTGPVIRPTVGRVVHYYRNRGVGAEEPLAALITKVHSETCVNLVVFDECGERHSHIGVELVQGEAVPNEDGYAVWMPYQKGQAAKTEEIEKRLTGGCSSSASSEEPKI